MRGVLGHHQHKRSHNRLIIVFGEGFQRQLDMLVVVDSVLKHDAFQRIGINRLRIKVRPSTNSWFLHITVFHRIRQVVAVNHVFKWLRLATCSFRRRRHLKAHNGLQLGNGLEAGTAAITVRFIHQQYQVIKFRQVREIAVANVLLQALDARGGSASHLGVDLRNVEDIDDHTFAAEEIGTAYTTTFFIVFSVNDQRRVMGKGINPLEHIFGAARVEIEQQLLIDRQVWCQNEKVSALTDHVQITDERAH